MAVSNTRIGVPVNLPNGARYDLLLVDTPQGYPEGKVHFRLLDTPRKITGIQKVAQMFLKILLTRRGTDVINPGLGTLFPEYALNANRTGTDQDLYAAITQEVTSAESQCKFILNTVGSDAASMVDSITILGLDTANEGIIMYVRLLTRAGQLAQVSVPFPQLDLKLSGE